MILTHPGRYQENGEIDSVARITAQYFIPHCNHHSISNSVSHNVQSDVMEMYSPQFHGVSGLIQLSVYETIYGNIWVSTRAMSSISSVTYRDAFAMEG
jgi:hypothetical protein